MKIIGVQAEHPSARFFESLSNDGCQFHVAELSELIKKDVDGILVNPEYSDEILKGMRNLTRDLKLIQFVDSLEKTHRGYFPRAGFSLDAVELLGLHVKTLDISKVAYIAGPGPWCRMMTYLAVQRGYAQVSLVAMATGESDEMIQDFQKFCFGVEMREVLHSELNLQPNNGSLLVVNASASEHEELLADLTYLNFLSLEGLVVDTGLRGQSRELLAEAEQSGIARLESHEVLGFLEMKALQKFGAWSFLNLNEYLEKKIEFVKNSPSV